jgi:hypothetical protein
MCELDLETAHQIACARELTYAAGVPLRDRYGYAASDEHIIVVLQALHDHADDKEAGDAIGLANALGEIQLADGYDTPIDERYERRIVAALRPLTDSRKRVEPRRIES